MSGVRLRISSKLIICTPTTYCTSIAVLIYQVHIIGPEKEPNQHIVHNQTRSYLSEQDSQDFDERFGTFPERFERVSCRKKCIVLVRPSTPTTSKKPWRLDLEARVCSKQNQGHNKNKNKKQMGTLLLSVRTRWLLAALRTRTKRTRKKKKIQEQKKNRFGTHSVHATYYYARPLLPHSVIIYECKD